MVESVLWHGMAIDGDLKLWQKNEPPIDILTMPYQSLKPMVLQAAARARTRAEWYRNTGNMLSKEILEIDRGLSQVCKNLDEVEQGMIRTSLMGGTQAMCEISQYNQDVENVQLL